MFLVPSYLVRDASAQFVAESLQGTISVTPRDMVVGLDYEEFQFAGGAFQRVAMSDLASIPGNGTGLMAITHYGGRVDIYDDTGNKLANPLIDIRATNPDLDVAIAHGVTAMAIHPDFATVGASGYGRFYVVETEAKDTAPADFVLSTRNGNHHQEALYEYQLASHTELACHDACEKRELFRVQQPGWHHNIGDMLFGPDGMLYISSADGSTTPDSYPDQTVDIMSDNSLDLTTVFGGILRIDPLGNNSANGKYGIPSDNPFADGVGGNVDEIYAYGLRNPYRLHLDSSTGDIYISETGEKQIESVEKLAAGGNFGWNAKEGSFLYDKFTKEITEDVDADGNGQRDFAETHNLIDPVFEYGRSDGRAIIGGVLYRGTEKPELVGKYVFADFYGGLFYGDPETGVVERFQIDSSHSGIPTNINSVEQDANGEVLLLGTRIVDNVPSGVITRLTGTGILNCDFDSDADCDDEDVNQLVAAIVAADNASIFDLNQSGTVDIDDLATWRLDAGLNNQGERFLAADINLDSVVDAADLNVLALHWQATVAEWTSGDLTADGTVDAQDLNRIGATWQQTSLPGRRSSVPEPCNAWITLALFFASSAVFRHKVAVRSGR